jgi:hypothetical protein
VNDTVCKCGFTEPLVGQSSDGEPFCVFMCACTRVSVCVRVFRRVNVCACACVCERERERERARERVKAQRVDAPTRSEVWRRVNRTRRDTTR